MSKANNRSSLRDTLFQKLTIYSRKAGKLGQRVRQLVFGFRLRSTIHMDRWVLPVKLLHDHRVLQRWRAHNKSGGDQSSVAQHALDKARHKNQQP